MGLDKYDRMLLSALLENGRASYADLARKVNLSAPAVAERVAKLEAAGVITGYEAKIDLSKIGLPIQCMTELRLHHLGNQPLTNWAKSRSHRMLPNDWRSVPDHASGGGPF
jgi:Lrp/AsnC family leucine-responsive transcriptional regulator